MSLTLTHASGRRQGEARTFEGDVVRLGRRSDNDLAFEDSTVSGSHAEVRREGRGYALYDRNSRNGTFVNGERVQRRELRDGDEIGLGQQGPRLRVGLRAGVAEAPARMEPRVSVSEGPMGLVLTHLAGSRKGQVDGFDAEAAGAKGITIGRGSSCALRFDPEQDKMVSRVHAEIRREDGAYVLYDRESTNGTFVDGRQVDRAELREGQVIRLGNSGPEVRVGFGAMAGGTASRPTGRKTMRMILTDALKVATNPVVDGGQKRPMGQSTMLFIKDFMGEVIHQTVHSSTHKLKVAVGVLSVALVGVTGIAVYGYIKAQEVIASLTADQDRNKAQWQRESLESQRRAGKLEKALEEAKEAGTVDRQRVEQLQGALESEKERIASFSTAIAEAGKALEDMKSRSELYMGFPEVAERYRNSVFMIGYGVPSSSGQIENFHGIGSGFAAPHSAGNIILTNAHVVLRVDEYKKEGEEAGVQLIFLAVRNGRGDLCYPIVGEGISQAHAEGLDVGHFKVKVNGLPPLEPVEFASEKSLQELIESYPIAVYGYPGEVMDDSDRAAEFLIGSINRLMDDGVLISHNTLTSPGTSGSPMFNGRGKVVGINFAIRTREEVDSLIVKETGEKIGMRFQRAATGRSLGLRSDVVEQYLRTIR